MADAIAIILENLAKQAEAVCRRYLSRGRREGHYWLVGDVANTRGRSLYVRLDGDGGAIGKWSDAATGEHGDLLDLIGRASGSRTVGESLAEARRFLDDPSIRDIAERGICSTDGTTRDLVTRLWEASQPAAGSIVATYLRSRGLGLPKADVLRFHPHCYYRPGADDIPGVARSWPAMIAAVRDAAGRLTGLHRTWLHPHRACKAPVAQPRRALGRISGHGVRFGEPGEVLIAGEGIETSLSVRHAAPHLPIVASLSAANLGSLLLPATLRRLYIIEDADPAGQRASTRLARRAVLQNVTVCRITALDDDLNTDLCRYGVEPLVHRLERCLDPRDRS